jgi:hypothetical protein
VVVLQALISFVGKSARKVLNAAFGWAVVSLFGRSQKQQSFLTAVVAMAALWPLALLGIALPRTAAVVVAFVPIISTAPIGTMRLVWAAIALAVPVTVGLAINAKTPPELRTASPLGRVLRGFPITLGIVGAFVLMFVTVPVLRIISAVRKRSDEHLPLITTGDQYHEAAARIDSTLHSHGIEVQRGRPPWWLSAPTGWLRMLAGKALRSYLPEDLAYWRGPAVEVAQYSSDVLIRGRKEQVAWTHGLLDEALASGPGLATHDPVAQELETQIQRIWSVLDENRDAHVQAKALLSRLDEVAREISRAEISYEQWQILYRKALQLGRALAGQAQLLRTDPTPSGSSTTIGEASMVAHNGKHEPKSSGKSREERPLGRTSTRSLVGQAVEQAMTLVKKESHLAMAELRDDVQRELAAAKKIGVAGLCALCTLNLLLLAAVLALAEAMPGWLAALLVAAPLLLTGAILGAVGWSKRVKVPLEKTRRSIKEDVRWIKERTA